MFSPLVLYVYQVVSLGSSIDHARIASSSICACLDLVRPERPRWRALHQRQRLRCSPSRRLEDLSKLNPELVKTASTTMQHHSSRQPHTNPPQSFSASLPFSNNLLVSSFFISTSSGNPSLQSSLPPRYLKTTLESRSLHLSSSLASL
jgi:hypothetical protein